MIDTGVRPEAPLPRTVAGAETATGRRATGRRTVVGPVSVAKPVENAPSVAVLRVKVKRTVALAPLARVSDDLSVVTSNPGTDAATVHVPACSAVNVRAMVTVAVTWPLAIDGMLRSVAAIGETLGPKS